MVSRSDCQVQRRIANVVLQVNFTAPRLQVVYGRIRASEACPVEWCALLVVYRVDAEAFLTEESQAIGLVALGSDV